MTPIADLVRNLLLGASVETSTVLTAVAWCTGLLVVGLAASNLLFRRRR